MDVTEMLIRSTLHGSQGWKGGQAETRTAMKRDMSVPETLASRSRSMTAIENTFFFLFVLFFVGFFWGGVALNFFLFLLPKNFWRHTGDKQ